MEIKGALAVQVVGELTAADQGPQPASTVVVTADQGPAHVAVAICSGADLIVTNNVRSARRVRDVLAHVMPAVEQQ